MNIAILGFGVVGKGVNKLALENGINVSHILMHSVNKITQDNMTVDFEEIVNDKNLDVIVECIGNIEPAFSYISKALNNKINVISSNKKLIATKYQELIDLANSNNVSFLFSSACGGGIPFLSELNKIKSSDDLIGFKGILNGTSNYILNKMFYENLDFDTALEKAQELGYAENDPSDDIDGIDTANKTILALGVGFDVLIKIDDIFIKGIRNYSISDLEFAKENGYHCCLLAQGIKDGEEYEISVLPTFVKQNSSFFAIRDNYNCLEIIAKNVGKLALIGQGAGSLPTASNVIRDIKSLSNSYKVNLAKRIYPNNNSLKTFYLRTLKSIDTKYIKKDLGNNRYITNEISIETLKDFINENDFVGEIIDD